MSVGQIRKIPTKYEQKEEKKNIVEYCYKTAPEFEIWMAKSTKHALTVRNKDV